VQDPLESEKSEQSEQQSQPQTPSNVISDSTMLSTASDIQSNSSPSIEQPSTSEQQSQDPININFGSTSQTSVEYSENNSNNLTNADHKEKKQESKDEDV
jgi:hypothetical protein